MDIDYLAELEITLDLIQTRLKAVETALTQLPLINMQADPSRPEGVVVEPAALDGL
jgi:hypothetical protein